MDVAARPYTDFPRGVIGLLCEKDWRKERRAKIRFVHSSSSEVERDRVTCLVRLDYQTILYFCQLCRCSLCFIRHLMKYLVNFLIDTLCSECGWEVRRRGEWLAGWRRGGRKWISQSREGGKGNRRTLSGSAAGRKTTSDFLNLSRRILQMSGTTTWMYMINRLGTIRFP